MIVSFSLTKDGAGLSLYKWGGQYFEILTRDDDKHF